MVDKSTIDRSINEALGKQNLDQAFKEVHDNFGTHKEEIVAGMDAVEEHGKTNKLLNILQVGEIVANANREAKVGEEARKADDQRKIVKKHNKGAVESRSRIEGGIKDIKEMLGGDEPRETQTDKLKKAFSTMAEGGGTGQNRSQVNANTMLASFASQAPKDLAGFAKIMEEADNDDRRDLLTALNKTSEVARGISGRDLDDQRKEFKNNQILKDAGINVDTGKIPWTEGFVKPTEDQMEQRGKAFKEFRTMTQEGRLTKPNVKARSGVDIETMPEKNFEVLSDIYDLLEKWYREGQGGVGGSGGVMPIGGRTPKPGGRVPKPGGNVKPPKPGTSVKPGPKPGKAMTGSKIGGQFGKGVKLPATGIPANSPGGKEMLKQGGVQAKSGKVFPKESPQANMIQNMGEAVPKEGKLAKVARVAGKVAGPLGAIASVGLEGYDAVKDIQAAEERAELGENDEAFLTEEALQREKFAEIQEASARTVGGLAAAGVGATKGAAIGTLIGGPVGTVAGALVGGAVGYVAGSELGEAGSAFVSSMRDDDLDAAQDSGLYNWEAWGDSILDRSKLADAPSPQLQAIIRHNDLNEADMNAVLEELASRGGTTSLSSPPTEPIEQEVAQELEASNLPTGDAIGNSQETLAEAEAEQAKSINISKDDNSVKNTTIEKGEAFLVEGPSTKDNSIGSWLTSGRSYIASA